MSAPQPPADGPSGPPEQDPSLDELLRRHAEGDPQALEALIVRLRVWLEPLVRNELRGTLRAREQTQDVVQEALSKLLGAFGRLDEGGLRQLAVRVVEHTLADLYRRHTSQRRDVRKEQGLDGQDGGTGPELGEDTATPPPVAANRTERQIRTRLVVQSLSPNHRQILELLDIQQRSAVEVAKELGVTPEVVRKRHHRARIAFSRAWVRKYGRDA